MTKEEIHFFKGFLEMHGMWSEFVREFYKPVSYVWRQVNHVGFHHSLESFLHDKEAGCAMEVAFSWRSSKSGHYRWCDFDDMWRKSLKRYER